MSKKKGKESDRKEKIAAAKQLLQEGIEEVFESGNFKRYLQGVSRLHTYSYQNILLIIKQCPVASRLHKFHTWSKKYWRYVKADEKAIRIRAAFKSNKDVLENDEDVNFRWIELFDISQTRSMIEGAEENEPPRESPVRPLPQPICEFVEHFESIVAAIKNISHYSIEFHKFIATNVQGKCIYPESKILILDSLSQLQTIRSLIHEVAHSYLHSHSSATEDKKRREMEAESVSFVVCNYFDIDTSHSSFDYVASFGQEKSKDEICSILDRIQVVSSYLIDAIEGSLEAEKIGYESSPGFIVLINPKRVKKLFHGGNLVYLVYPGEGESFVFDEKQIENHDGPFSVERTVVQKGILQAA